MFGDERRILVGRFRFAGFDRGGQPPVQLGAIRFELSLIRHRTNERMVKDVLRLSSERDLIDELGRHQVSSHRLNT